MQTNQQTPHYLWPATTLLFAGFALRVYHLDAQALSGDEAFTIINWSRAPIQQVLTTIAVIDPQPPFTLLSINGWLRLVGDTEFAARALSVLASLLALAALYAITRTLFSGSRNTIAITALALATISPLQIWYAQDVRSYALWIATSALSAWTILLAVRKPWRTRRWAAYVAIATIGMYTFYLEGFFLLAQNLYVLTQLRAKPRMLKPWLASQATIALLLAPWFLQPILRRASYQPTAGPANIPWAFEALLFGETVPTGINTPLLSIGPHAFTPAAIIAILLTAVALTSLVKTRRVHIAIFLALYTLLPIMLLAALTTITNQGFFRPRYIAAASIPLALCTATLFATTLHSPHLTRPTKALLTALLTLSIFSINATSLWTYYFVQSKAPAWREIAQTLATQTHEHDLIIRNYPDPAFDYYYTATTDYVLLPNESNTPQHTTEHQLTTLLQKYRYLWLMPVPNPAYDANQTVYNWLENNAQRISAQWIGDTHLLQYATWQVNPTAIDHPMRAVFAETAILEGFRITPTTTHLTRNTTLYIETFWRPLRQTEQGLTLFIHLLGPQNETGTPLWAQDDHPPQRDRITTQTWQPGQLYRDVAEIQIPPGALPGSYTIAVGLYDPDSDDRIPARLSTESSPVDSITLTTFNLP